MSGFLFVLVRNGVQDEQEYSFHGHGGDEFRNVRRLRICNATLSFFVNDTRSNEICGLTVLTHPNQSSSARADDVKLIAYPEQRVIRIIVPLFCQRQLFFRLDRAAKAILFSDDPRLLYQAGMQRHPKALLSALEFPCIAAPFSPWLGISRVCPGTELKVDTHPAVLSEHPVPRLSEPSSEYRGAEEFPKEHSQRSVSLGRTLDRAIQRRCPEERAVILFSGGVDSGLIAARCRALGWEDVVLLNCSMKSDDPESLHAEEMARKLKYRFVRVEYDQEFALSHLSQALNHCAVYNDFSALPMLQLAHYAAQNLSGYQTVFDGTAADALFGSAGSAARWQRLYRLPSLFRSAGNAMYSAFQLWQNESRVEQVCRHLTRSAHWPFPLGTLALHPLADVAYHAPRRIRTEAFAEIENWKNLVFGTESLQLQFQMLHLVHHNAGSQCQKAMSVFRDWEQQAVFPFLDADLVRFAMRSPQSDAEHEPKALLKELLAQHVPSTLVYRKKSGFSIHPTATFGHPIFLDALEQALAWNDNPYHPWLKREVIESMKARLLRKAPLSWYTYCFLWAFVFASEWYRRSEIQVPASLQIRSNGPARRTGSHD